MNFHQTLLERASHPYLAAGNFAWNFSKGKLRGDPVFFELIEKKLIPDSERLVDLGCGQGLLASWLIEAQTMHLAGEWPFDIPAPPRVDKIWGLEIAPKQVERARIALKDRAQIEVGDICDADLGKADTVIILDVLHYIAFDEQEKLLHRVREALPVGGTFITRIGDASAGLIFYINKYADRAISILRGSRSSKVYCRTLDEWVSILKKNGFDVQVMPMNKNKLFCNVLLVGKAI